MRKRLAFEIHHGRAIGFIPPGVTPPTERMTGVPSTTASAPANRATTAAETTPAATTPAPAATTAQTTAAKDTKKDKDKDDPTTTGGAATTTTQVTPSTTVARTTSAVPTTTPAVVTTRDNPNTVVAFDPTTSETKQFTVTRTARTTSVPSNSSSALPSAPAEDNGPSVGSIAGYAGATLAGIAVISIFAIWMIRRRRRRQEDADLDATPFNRHSWLRNSTMIHDDAPTPATTDFPPPRRDPDMIDRSFNATPVTNYAGMNQFPQNNFGYATQPSYQPGAVIFSPSSANTSFGPGPGAGPATPLPFSPVYDPSTPNPFEQQTGYTEVTRGAPPHPFNPYHNQQQFEEIPRHMTPSAPLPALPRTPSPTTEAAPPVLPPIATGAAGATDTFGRVSAYPELSPAPTSAHGHVVEVRASTYEGQATPVQYGFVEGPQASVAAAPSTQPPAVLQPAGRVLTRPETVYDTEDAYGGI